MTTRIFTDRSRILTYQRCARRRWLEYSEGPSGVGIAPSRKPLPLAVGSAVHAGLAVLLSAAQDLINTGDNTPVAFAQLEETAVLAALADFSQHSGRLDVDTTEIAAMQPTESAKQFAEQAIAQAKELGMDIAAMGGFGLDPAEQRSQFDAYLFSEQSALVEALVRAYSRRRLEPLLEQFEVLEVEREGEWRMSPAIMGRDGDGPEYELSPEIWFMSRPDALLRERQSNELYLLSYKTTGSWDVRKARDIQHDMQGLSEGVEVERRLGEWWQTMQDGGLPPRECEAPMREFLASIAAPPRIHAIRYEFLLKGDRWKDKDLSQRMGMEVRSQRSHLIRQYVATSVPKRGDGGYSLGDVAWSWDFYRPEDDKNSNLAWANWKSQSVWDNGGVKAWIDKLDQSELLMSGEDSTLGLAPRELGWKSSAQAMGVTKGHPLDSVFVPPVTVWRSDDDLRDWVESTEAQERRVADAVALVRAATDPGERRSLLNIHFPMNRTSCEFPSQCPFAREKIGVCYAGAEMKDDPLTMGAGEYVERVVNHPQESQLIDITK
jgi:hypothetical protein